MKKIIDTHIHVWDLAKADYAWLKNDQSLLNRTWSLDELDAERKQIGITSGILVQAAGNSADTDNMLVTARRHDWIEGVVAWLPLMDPAATNDALEQQYRKEPLFKGVRHQIHDEPDPKWLLQPAVLESLSLLADHGIPFDIVGILPEHIETALEVSHKIPGLRMVFDHLNQPPMAAKKNSQRWESLMREAAARPNLYVKISGLGTASGNFDNWTKEDIQSSIEWALNEFGPERCLCGGDWPVALLAGSYTKTWQAYQQVLSELLNESQQQMVLAGTAENFYMLTEHK